MEAGAADRAVRALQLRLILLGALRRTAAFSAPALFAAGIVALILRAVGASHAGLVVVCAALPPTALLVSAALAAYRRPRPEQWRALLDAESCAGGLLVAAAETPLGEWAARLPPVRAPRLRWNAGPVVGRLSLALAFAAAAFLVPMGAVEPFGRRPLEIGETVRKLDERLAEIEQAALVAVPEIEALRGRLEQAAAETSGDDPARTWEMLDRLAEQIENAARDSVAQAVQSAAALAEAADALNQALRQFEAAGGEAAGADAAAELASAMKELAAALQNPSLAGALNPETAALLNELMKDAPRWSAQDLQRLAEVLGQSGQNLAQTLQTARSFQLLDPRDLDRIIEQLKNCGAGGSCASDADTVALAFGEGDIGSTDLSTLAAGLPGAGGITRGPGAAEITFNEAESSPEGADFKPIALPRPPRLAAEGTVPLRVSAAAPDTSAAVAAGPGGALAAPGEGAAARRHTVWPRHRGAVRRYFERISGESP